MRDLLRELAALPALLPEQTCSGVKTIRTVDLNAESGERLMASPRD